MNTGIKAGRTRAWLGLIATSVAAVLALATPTPLALLGGAAILVAVAAAVWTMRCPRCHRRLGPVIGFQYCTSCGARLA